VVVAVGPLTSVKEQAAGTYAEAMSARGYAALAFNYRCFGESGGRRRQFEKPEAKIEDIRNAATALPWDDRLTGLPLFGVGVCFGAWLSHKSRALERSPTRMLNARRRVDRDAESSGGRARSLDESTTNGRHRGLMRQPCVTNAEEEAM
jgi:hypothetical protein